MAIAFARVSIHSRAKGHSAVAAISYLAGIKLVDERTGLTHNFSHREDVVFSEVIIPKNSNSTFLDRSILWNAFKAAEKEFDAQLCKNVVLSLPKELNREQLIALTRRRAHQYFKINNVNNPI